MHTFLAWCARVIVLMPAHTVVVRLQRIARRKHNGVLGDNALLLGAKVARALAVADAHALASG